jgi:hypothetical protein
MAVRRPGDVVSVSVLLLSFTIQTRLTMERAGPQGAARNTVHDVDATALLFGLQTRTQRRSHARRPEGTVVAILPFWLFRRPSRLSSHC